MKEMKDFFSVLQLLKRFGIFIYTGDRNTDIELMMSEVKELFDNGLILKEDYLRALLILKKELN
ncbi:YqgQ family protein [Sporosarcina thermotolerans]|uniref:YqgQ family protein n=1 Tax=Sporosarcina thermotolerans TaxID=633404 RepID=A0AAW9ADX9_9BACL|nr:YqgQ family protein [Sporosarcina thermotolerans]MDW0117348.1 YqgQ family protein [Sporosarcina thermotolerans]WHT47498.1 YqgQ family protein [Sporosarcina thermotolerans]